jgi:hypothetical protein
MPQVEVAALVTALDFNSERFDGVTSGYAYVFNATTFTTAEGVAVLASHWRRRDEDLSNVIDYERAAWTLNVTTGQITIGAFTIVGNNPLYSTEDAAGGHLSSYTLALFTTDGTFITIVYEGIVVPSSPASTTWLDLYLNGEDVVAAQTSQFTVLEFSEAGQGVDCGQFYPENTDLGTCFYEAWVRMSDDSAGSYIVADGYGPRHAMLWSPINGNVFGGSKTVTNASNTTPIVITTSAVHRWTTGASIIVASVLGNTAANGTWTITVISPTTFSLNTSVGNGAYVSGGTAEYLVQWGVDDHPYEGQWAHVAVGISDNVLVTYYDGVPVGKTAFLGPRETSGYGLGGGRLGIGAFDHSNFQGRISQVGIFEGVHPQLDAGVGNNKSAFIPQTILGTTWEGNATVVERQFLMSFFSNAQIVPDLSSGFASGVQPGIHHPGRLRNMTLGVLAKQNSYPAPQYVVDTTAPNSLTETGVVQPSGKAYTPSATPASALAFDSFQRKNSTYAFDNFGGLGSTESGSLGALPWIERGSPGATSNKKFGILNEKGVVLSNFDVYSTEGYFAKVSCGTANVDIRVSRNPGTYGTGISTGIVFRVIDDSNWCFAFTGGTLSTNQVLYAGEVVAGVVTYWVNGSVSLPASWTVLRVTTLTTGAAQIFADATSLDSRTDTTNAAGQGHGIMFAPIIEGSAYRGTLAWRYLNFTVLPFP